MRVFIMAHVGFVTTLWQMDLLKNMMTLEVTNPLVALMFFPASLLLEVKFKVQSTRQHSSADY